MIEDRDKTLIDLFMVRLTMEKPCVVSLTQFSLKVALKYTIVLCFNKWR